MEILIVVGDGDPNSGNPGGSEQDDQAREFLSYAAWLAKDASKADLSWKVFAPQRTASWYRTNNKKTEWPAIAYGNLSELMQQLNSEEPKTLIVIGHGYPYVSDSQQPIAAVHLCPGGASPSDRDLTPDMVNKLKPRSYFGFHCHSGNFVRSLQSEIIGFFLNKQGVGQNSDIKAVAEEAEEEMTQVLGVLAIEGASPAELKEMLMSSTELVAKIKQKTGKKDEEAPGWR
jgi:hypothetical protein